MYDAISELRSYVIKNSLDKLCALLHQYRKIEMKVAFYFFRQLANFDFMDNRI